MHQHQPAIVEVSEEDLVIADAAVEAVVTAAVVGAVDVVAVFEAVARKKRNGSPLPNSVA
jgi:hypothetical protein